MPEREQQPETPVTQERRREPRVPCIGEAHIMDAASGTDLGHAIITNISASGASLSVYCPLLPGTHVRLQQDSHVFHGEIRYCIHSGPDFRLGIELIPPEQWSPGQSWPTQIEPPLSGTD